MLLLFATMRYGVYQIAVSMIVSQTKARLRPFVLWLHLMGELSAKPTEGENPVCRTKKPAEFDRLSLNQWLQKRHLIAPILAGRNQQHGSCWQRAQPAKT